MVSPTFDKQKDRLKRIRLVRRITRILDIPMALLSLMFLFLFIGSLSVCAESPYRLWFDRGITIIWTLFILEFLLKFFLTPYRVDFIRKHWFDLIVIILPILRTLRVYLAFKSLHSMGIVFRIAASGRGLSLFKVLLFFRRGVRGFREFIKISNLGYIALLTSFVVISSSVAILWFESGTDKANIRSFNDALWWSAAIVTTVACDLNPVSTGGRILGVCLMIYGVMVFGYFVSYAVTFIQGRESLKKK